MPKATQHAVWRVPVVGIHERGASPATVAAVGGVNVGAPRLDREICRHIEWKRKRGSIHRDRCDAHLSNDFTLTTSDHGSRGEVQFQATNQRRRDDNFGSRRRGNTNPVRKTDPRHPDREWQDVRSARHNLNLNLEEAVRPAGAAGRRAVHFEHLSPRNRSRDFEQEPPGSIGLG